jgi:hypothetical protein
MTTLSCPPPQGGPWFTQGGARCAQGGPALAQADAAVVQPSTSAARTAALMGASALAGLFLAACGGDDTGTPPPPPAAATEVPTSAAQSTASLEAFAIAQPLSDNTEPLLLDNVPTFPTSESEEPIAVP